MTRYRFIVSGSEKTAGPYFQSLVKFLVENGADINAVSKNNDSVLILAIRKGKLFKNCYYTRKKRDEHSLFIA